MSQSPNLSGKENTPEFHQAIVLAQNGGRGDRTFYTTLGHIVTKILDMDMSFNLADGSEYRPFTTVGEVNTFFRITPDQYGINPNPSILDQFVSKIYKTKVVPMEKTILDDWRKTMRDFFELNIWGDVKDDDTVDILLGKIDELVDMGIEEVSQYVCNDLKEWIVTNCIGKGRNIDDWNGLSSEEREKHIVGYLDKEKYTDYFVNLVVDLSWKNHPNNPYKYMMNTFQYRIYALYRVDGNFEKNLGSASQSQFRNTRYL